MFQHFPCSAISLTKLAEFERLFLSRSGRVVFLKVPTCFTGLAPRRGGRALPKRGCQVCQHGHVATWLDVASRRTNNKTTAQAEAASSSGSSSVALVKVTKENSIATAGVLGGVAGLLLGGFWIGAAGFVATSYLAKKD
eukprot:g8122.t1